MWFYEQGEGERARISFLGCMYVSQSLVELSLLVSVERVRAD